jgi:hypothetical protein
MNLLNPSALLQLLGDALRLDAVRDKVLEDSLVAFVAKARK